MFLQIHTLTSYAAGLLNRDDAGLAKRIPFGNAERMRVSSQCLKKHWRDDFHRNLDLPGGIRSRLFFEREILARVVEAGINQETATKLTEALLKRLIQGGQKKDAPLQLNQPVLFGKPEADYLVSLIKECAGAESDPVKLLDERLKAEKGNLQAMWKTAGVSLVAGIEGALFGRFVTSDILARTDAAVHVAHAFTVHPLATEVDYFTVVDDLKEADEDAGAAHAGDMELGAGLFYGYIVVDVPLLVSNLCGCDPTAWKKQPKETIQDVRDVLSRLIEAIATVSPGAKLGATAPYARAACVLLETGKTQPRTLANAYLEALKPKGNLERQAVEALGQHLAALDAMYGREENRFVSTTVTTESLADVPRAPLKASIAAVLDSLFGAG
ncbi:MAG: type I-E CRISPR-associated protein Cas7/Cse4/CasC [Thiobacillus sp.]|nr:type I-E CRISPR-associated protein Cas7/Cse4/CasC [Thiobacillus sp.]